MKFIDLQKQYQVIEASLLPRIQQLLQSSQFIMGQAVYDLEEKLAEFVGVKHCVSVNSGTTALLMALMALDIQPGDEFITTPFTFYAPVEMLQLLGAVPVFVDIDPKTYNLDATLIEAAITPRTKAIMPVSLYGQCCDMDSINAMALKHGLFVIEDGAQSFGATYKGKRSCGVSTIGCTSFFPSKPLGCYGEGGACFTNDDDIALRMQQIRNHGQNERYKHALVGLNGRLDTLQAVVLLEKLALFEGEIKQRQQVAAWYDDALSDSIQKPTIHSDNVSVYAQYTLQVEQRDAVIEYLSQHDIPTAVHYPMGIHQQVAFTKAFPDVVYQLPVTEKVAGSVLSLPFHPYLTQNDVSLISDTLHTCFSCEVV